MRYAFINTLIKEASKNEDIILLTGDLGFTVFEEFREKFPDRFINVGIAEQNMMSVAAGLALSGKIVFAYSIAAFSSMRPFEQIRNDIAAHNAHVIIVGSGSGLSYGHNLHTHHATEDMSLMRVIPNMIVLSPSDPHEVIWGTKELINLKKPAYLRLGKKGEPNMSEMKPYLEFGKARELLKGKDIVILTTGVIVENVMKSVKLLENKGIRSSVYSMHTIKPFDYKFVKKLLNKYKHIVTVEEHSIVGGLGSAVAEVIAENKTNSKLFRIGIPDKFIFEVGSQDYLRKKVRLTPETMAYDIFKFIKKV